MNTNLIVGIIAGVVVLGGAVYFFSRPGDSDQEANGPESGEEQTAGSFSGSIKDLAARGGSWKCDIDTSTSQAVSSGTVYVDGKNIRADFSSNVEGYGVADSHMIADGEYVYSWSSVAPQGMKVKMTLSDGSGEATAQAEVMDSNVEYAYDCQQCSADQSKFSLPNSVMFMELAI
jgi:hypothetical protein